MDNSHSITDQSNQVLSSGSSVKIEEEFYSPAEASYQTLQNVPHIASDNNEFAYSPMAVKDETQESALNSSIHFPQGAVPVIGSGSQIKVNANHILSSNIPVVSQGVQINSGGRVLMTSNESGQKVLVSSPSILSLGHAVQNCIPISQEPTVSSSRTSSNNQPVQIIHTSIDNCENVLNPSHPSGQTYILTSTGNVLSSGDVTQGQVFLQGDELINVNIPTSVSNSSTYSIANSDPQYMNSIPMVIGGTQSIGGQLSRLIIQPNQAQPNVNNQIISSNGNHYIIQMGQTLNSTSQNKLLLNNKGHIVIKAGTPKNKESNVTSPIKDGVFRVVIPEGTTKLPKLNPSQAVQNSEDVIRKHVQINLSNRAAVPSLSENSIVSSDNQLKGQRVHDGTQPEVTRKLYECPDCKSKFIRPLYLRMHMRSCNKPEVKAEKTPLLMCSFCKATFKTKELISEHFVSCSQRLSLGKENANKKDQDDQADVKPSKRSRVVDVDTSLEAAILYKCQDCDRTFSKERQYTSHVKRCTKVSVHDLSGVKTDTNSVNTMEDGVDEGDDPFADIPAPPASATKRSRSTAGSGRRGRPPSKVAPSLQKAPPPKDVLFEGEDVSFAWPGLMVADNENLVRSTAGLSHTVQMSLDAAKAEGIRVPNALMADFQGVRGRNRLPQFWSLVCSLCQRLFLTKAALGAHMMQHHGAELRTTRDTLHGVNPEEKLYKCPLCSLHYATGEVFLEHLLSSHTSKLQSLYKLMQSKSTTFVCSLCSLVLLTREMLLEHLSLEHLDYLERLSQSAQRVAASRRRRQEQNEAEPKKARNLNSANGEVDFDSSHPSDDDSVKKEEDSYYLDLQPNESGKYECGLCCEEFYATDLLIQHYILNHEIDVSSDGLLKDAEIDVDIRVKGTADLLRYADEDAAKLHQDTSVPSKTVLIRRRPKQNWKCQRCQMVFPKQALWARHVRQECKGSDVVPASEPPAASGTKNPQRESHFMCSDPDCRLLSFFQVKSLFKHMETVHNVVVPKERQTFESLEAFLTWLKAEEERSRVYFVRETVRTEKGGAKLVQMVCHRFHQAKLAEQNRDRDETDITCKPSKKRWTSRVHRANFCHARIHLRVEVNRVTSEHDWETQMIYYPQHSHDPEENSEVMDKLRETYPRDKNLIPSHHSSASKHGHHHNNSVANQSYLIDADSASSFSLDSPAGADLSTTVTKMEPVSETSLQDHTMIASSQETSSPSTTQLPMSSLLVPSVSSPQPTHAVLLPPAPELLTEHENENRFLVMGAQTDEVAGEGSINDFGEEYVLPADEAEWSKLFGALGERITSGALTEVELKEAESLLAYRSLIPVIGISEQVSIFQRVCAITNTSLESV